MKKERFEGLTYIRAIFSWIIVVWHGHFLGTTPGLTVQDHYYVNWRDVFQFNIVPIGVPIFLVMSLFLYVEKYHRLVEDGKDPAGYLKKRLVHFFVLYVVWRIVYAFFNIGTFWVEERGLVRNIYHLVFGADTILYFFVELLWLIPATHIVLTLTSKLTNRKKTVIYVSLLVVSVAITSSVYLWPLGVKMEALRYFSPVGFLPYLPVALLTHHLFRNYFSHCNKIILILAPLSIVLSVLDWIVLPDNIYFSNGINAPITGYGRPSLVVASIVLILLVLKIKQKPPMIIENLGNISLYVFCTHMIFRRLFDNLPFVWFVILVTLSTLIVSEALYYLISYIKGLRRKPEKV